MRFLSVPILIIALAAIGGQAWAQTGGKTITDRVFSEVEKRILKDYLGQGSVKDTDRRAKNKTKGKGKGKGRGKNKRMPPGLARQLEKNGTLPPGLARRELPAGLASRLPPRGSNQERVIVDNDVVLIEKGTGIILDILKDVIAKR